LVHTLVFPVLCAFAPNVSLGYGLCLPRKQKRVSLQNIMLFRPEKKDSAPCCRALGMEFLAPFLLLFMRVQKIVSCLHNICIRKALLTMKNIQKHKTLE